MGNITFPTNWITTTSNAAVNIGIGGGLGGYPGGGLQGQYPTVQQAANPFGIYAYQTAYYDAVAPAPAPAAKAPEPAKPRPDTHLDWLDRRVNEMRVAL